MSATAPEFPPLMQGEAARQDAFAQACKRAAAGCDAGLVTYRIRANDLQAALVFAPEVSLARAMAMHPLCGVGLQNALGALAPPEVAVHLDWNGTLRLNGGICGRLRAAAARTEDIPDWLVIGFELSRLPATDNPGDMPEETSLHAEGCGDLSPPELIGAWARHCLHWINDWETDGPRALHAEWRGLLYDPDAEGTIGVDEDFGLLQQGDGGLQVTPLTTLLEAP